VLFFAIPKLVGIEKSVKGFEQFKSLVPAPLLEINNQ
jgi:hypothetical protein